jgi:site-specific recombinase XerC
VFRPVASSFESFLLTTRKPSVHTMKAYRRDFDAIAALITDGDDAVPSVALNGITTESMRPTFARSAETHEAASIQRCSGIFRVEHRPACPGQQAVPDQAGLYKA